MKKTFLPQTINTKKLNQKTIAIRCLSIFKDHIGEEKAISKEGLYYEIFNERFDNNNLRHYVYWDFTLRAMNMLRHKSNCFIRSIYLGNMHYYFVLKTDDEAINYCDYQDLKIKRIKKIKQKAKKSVKEKWYSSVWIIDKQFKI